MKDLTIINEGFKDFLDPLNEMEMNFVLGGDEKPGHVRCKKGYTSSKCECEYEGPAYPQQVAGNYL